MRLLPVPTKPPLQKGPIYFVDAAKGDDRNDGSQAKPWKSIQHGQRRLKPGDTLYLRGGTYCGIPHPDIEAHQTQQLFARISY